MFKVAGGLNGNLPNMYHVKQNIEDIKITDISGEVVREFRSVNASKHLKNGQRIAITVGSRGITNIKEIVKNVIEQVEKLGCKPFIVPSMGSHGNADAEKQKELLAHFGITEKNMGVPIESSMEVVKVGTVGDDFEVFVDKVAMNADGIILVNRVKSHTDFSGDIESGLMKMMVIGLGNHIGCSSIHSRGSNELSHLVPEAGRLILQQAPVIFGIAIIENAYGNTFKIEGILPEKIEEREKQLLLLSKEQMAKLPVDNLDVLIIEEMGKNISGTGMDTNVIGRIRIEGCEEPEKPDINKIVLLGLTNETEGSAVGIGLADIITNKLMNEVDFSSTYTNCIAANCIERAFIPLVSKDDHDAIALAMKLSRGWDLDNIKMIKIKNTLVLNDLEVSQAVWEEIKSKKDIELIKGPYVWEY